MKTVPGAANQVKQSNYETRTGTVTQLLDEFEKEVMRKFPHHRFTIARQKASAAEFDRNRGPGVVQSDVDYAMDGEIPPPEGRSIQSQHWSPMGYTAFIQVVSWLVTAAWIDQSSELPIGAAVTVEPSDSSEAGATIPAVGSFWAEVVSLPCVASAGRYSVRRYGAAEDAEPELIERHLLRHRKLMTKAFIHISNDKTHDSYAAQTFMNQTFYWIGDSTLHSNSHAQTLTLTL
jgi:hypothetical protein